MAKILCNYFGLSMAAEGKSEFVGRQAAFPTIPATIPNIFFID